MSDSYADFLRAKRAPFPSPANPSGAPTGACTFSETNALVSRSARIAAVGIGLLETNAVIAAEQELDDGLDYFAVCGERDRATLVNRRRIA